MCLKDVHENFPTLLLKARYMGLCSLGNDYLGTTWEIIGFRNMLSRREKFGRPTRHNEVG